MRLQFIRFFLKFLLYYQYVIIGRAFLSFVLPYTHPIMKFLKMLTDPIVEPFRKFLSKRFPTMMLDFSPIFALLFLRIIANLVILLI